MTTSRQFNRLVGIILTMAPLMITGCVVGEGEGPERIQNSPATPIPTLPPGFCDPINFEVLCEQPTIENFEGGETTLIDNPQVNPDNDSERVAQMQKFGGQAFNFGGTKLTNAERYDFADGEVFLMKVFSQRTGSVAVTFKLEEQGNPGGGREIVLNHTGGSNWQELCYDFTGQTAGIPTDVIAVTLIFDNGTPGAAGTDPDNWTFFYDDITQVANCPAG